MKKKQKKLPGKSSGQSPVNEDPMEYDQDESKNTLEDSFMLVEEGK